MASAYKLTATGVTLQVRVTPNAGRDALEGVLARDDGTLVLAIRTKAVPEDGKANSAVVAIIAKALGFPKFALSVISGQTSRQKSIAISGDGAAISAALEYILRSS